MYTYDHPRAANTVDILLFRGSRSGWQVLLIQRKKAPFQGKYALPGGFVDENETLEDAALRELAEETGIKGVDLTQIHTFGDPGRDPRGWVISTTYGLLLEKNQDVPLTPGSDAKQAAWFDIIDLPPLAFDHELIIKTGLRNLGLDDPH